MWIAGGVGVAPFLSWLRALDGDLPHRVDFFYTADGEAPFADEIRDIADRHESLHAHLIDTSVEGRLTTERVLARRRRQTASRLSVFMCGPPGMLRTLRDRSCGWRACRPGASTASTSTGAEAKSRCRLCPSPTAKVGVTDRLPVGLGQPVDHRRQARHWSAITLRATWQAQASRRSRSRSRPICVERRSMISCAESLVDIVVMCCRSSYLEHHHDRHSSL